MELRVLPYDAATMGQQRCENAYCGATVTWQLNLILSDEGPGVAYTCGSHLMSLVSSAVDNMRIRLK